VVEASADVQEKPAGRMQRGYSAAVFSVRQEQEKLSFISRLLEPTTARRRLSADAQVLALPSQKCQRRRLDAGLDSFRRIENAFCRVFGPKPVKPEPNRDFERTRPLVVRAIFG